jgi:hypothetical protein
MTTTTKKPTGIYACLIGDCTHKDDDENCGVVLFDRLTKRIGDPALLQDSKMAAKFFSIAAVNAELPQYIRENLIAPKYLIIEHTSTRPTDPWYPNEVLVRTKVLDIYLRSAGFKLQESNMIAGDKSSPRRTAIVRDDIDADYGYGKGSALKALMNWIASHKIKVTDDPNMNCVRTLCVMILGMFYFRCHNLALELCSRLFTEYGTRHVAVAEVPTSEVTASVATTMQLWDKNTSPWFPMILIKIRETIAKTIPVVWPEASLAGGNGAVVCKCGIQPTRVRVVSSPNPRPIDDIPDDEVVTVHDFLMCTPIILLKTVGCGIKYDFAQKKMPMKTVKEEAEQLLML